MDLLHEAALEFGPVTPQAKDDVRAADEAVIAELLRAKIQEKAGERGYSRLDRKLGRGGTGWTSKFMRGKERVSTISALLKILRALEVEPAEFFMEAFPLTPKGLDEDEVVARFIESLTAGGAASEAIQRLVDRTIAERLPDEHKPKPAKPRPGTLKKGA